MKVMVKKTNSKKSTKPEIITNMPVAKFWYKGSHTHPVRRTVVLVEATKDYLKGFELREGKTVRALSRSPIKTYVRGKIAKAKSLRTNNPLRILDPERTTLVRRPMSELNNAGF
jgi:hypothetical protein